MSKTVVVISDTGRLVDVAGVDKELDSHYLQFAKRLLGDDGTYATIDYGWNNRTKLKITGADGQEILLDAQEVNISGTLKINGIPINEIIDNRVDLELIELQGTPGEIDVNTIDDVSSDSSSPQKTYVVSLSEDLKGRISNLENQVAGVFSFDAAYYAGDGLITLNNPVRNTINVFLGTGLKFESKSYKTDFGGAGSSDELVTYTKNAVAVDCESTPIPLSVKPITAGAVFEAIEEAVEKVTDRYTIKVESTTGNIVLLDNLASSIYLSSSESQSSPTGE